MSFDIEKLRNFGRALALMNPGTARVVRLRESIDQARRENALRERTLALRERAQAANLAELERQREKEKALGELRTKLAAKPYMRLQDTFELVKDLPDHIWHDAASMIKEYKGVIDEQNRAALKFNMENNGTVTENTPFHRWMVDTNRAGALGGEAAPLVAGGTVNRFDLANLNGGQPAQVETRQKTYQFTGENARAEAKADRRLNAELRKKDHGVGRYHHRPGFTERTFNEWRQDNPGAGYMDYLRAKAEARQVEKAPVVPATVAGQGQPLGQGQGQAPESNWDKAKKVISSLIPEADPNAPVASRRPMTPHYQQAAPTLEPETVQPIQPDQVAEFNPGFMAKKRIAAKLKGLGKAVYPIIDESGRTILVHWDGQQITGITEK